jgi:hypothetical protein
MIHEVAVEAAGAEETDQGPAQAGAEDPDPDFWKI